MIVEKFVDKPLVDSKWIFKIKENPDDIIHKPKLGAN